MKKVLSASILSADFARLGDEVNSVLSAGINYIHFDVMDHHFVPNLTFGAIVCQSLRKSGITAPIDVHLMVDNPLSYIESFAKAGASLITFHPETVASVTSTLQLIRAHGMKAGLAFNPEHPVVLKESFYPYLDMILLMTVNPGFGGQAFQSQGLKKISETRLLLKNINYPIMLGVDGGIKVDNIGSVAKAGADFFVVGSGLFHANDYKERVQALRQQIEEKISL